MSYLPGTWITKTPTANTAGFNTTGGTTGGVSNASYCNWLIGYIRSLLNAGPIVETKAEIFRRLVDLVAAISSHQHCWTDTYFVNQNGNLYESPDFPGTSYQTTCSDIPSGHSYSPQFGFWNGSYWVS